jgi:hypothetical protein
MNEPKAEAGDTLRQLTAGDWIGVALAMLGASGILLEAWLWLPAWEGIFKDFGEVHLPTLTRLVLWGPFPYLAVLPALAALGIGLAVPGRGLAWRRAWIVVAFLLAFAGVAFIEWSVRLPLLQLAASLQ